MPNLIEIGEITLEKSVTKIFTPLNILAPHGDPLGQILPVWVMGGRMDHAPQLEIWPPLPPNEIFGQCICTNGMKN